MTGMAPLADLSALLMGSTARWTVRYGNSLQFSGRDIARPTVHKVPTRHGPVRCEVYLPTGIDAPPTYVHFHGGAFLMRYPKMDDFFCRFVAAEVGAAVVNVDYGVAPRHRYPVAQDQSHDVLAWLTVNAGEWGLDPDRIAVGGFSAGGNLAASACLQARDRRTAAPRLQLLAVPSLDVAGDIHGKSSVIANPMIGPQLLSLVRKTYFRDAVRRQEPYASPLLATDVSGLPPAVVVTGEHDTLRAEGDAYAERLREAGLLVDHQVIPGRDHYFLDGDRDQARTLLDLLASHLRSALA